MLCIINYLLEGLRCDRICSLTQESLKDLSDTELFLISWNFYNEKDRHQGPKPIWIAWI